MELAARVRDPRLEQQDARALHRLRDVREVDLVDGDVVVEEPDEVEVGDGGRRDLAAPEEPFIPSTVEKRSATAHDGAATAGAALLHEHRSITVPFACVRTTEPSSVASKRLMLTRKLGFFAHARSIRANVSCSVAGCSQLSSVRQALGAPTRS